MSGDYTRLTFRPQCRFSSVRVQQGRVQLDADCNEAADIGLLLDRTTTTDVVGAEGVPEGAPGFALTPADPDGAGAATDLLIGFGRAYVDGVLVENLPPAPTLLTAVAASPGNFLVAAGPVPAVGQWLIAPPGSAIVPARVTALPAPVAADGGLTRITLAPPPAGASVSLAICPSLLRQPDLLDPALPATAGRYGVYLDVLERPVTALDDPLLRETALGGPDTCLREQVVWQLRPDTSGTHCKDYAPGWVPDAAPRARMSAQGVPAIADDDPCLTPDPGGYRGIDNRLYRVQVHRGGDVAAGTVLVKWSRDNAIHRTSYTVTAGRLRVASLGRDDATAFAQNQWVELQDDAAWRELRSGHMVRLGEVNGLDIAIAEIRDPATNAAVTDAGGDPQVAALPAVGTLRRWEGGVPVAVAADTALALESGIQVTFGAGRLSAGDWWTIPARTLTAAIEWPADPATGDPLAIPAQGVAHHVMPLGIVERTAGGRLRAVEDCRNLFPPLTDILAFEMLGGDGQEAMPSLLPGQQAKLVPLAAPLRTGVARGTTPLAGRAVRYTTAGPNPGRLDPAPGIPAARVLRALPTDLIIATDADGVAEARFSIHGNRTDYTVLARLLASADPAVAAPMLLPIVFTASAEIAAEVAYDPRGCLFQQHTPGEKDPSATVQEAIDRLCPAIQFLPLGGDGQTATPGQKLPAPLRVGLLWGGRPLAGTVVHFEVASGNVNLPNADVTTSADGTATVDVVAGDDPAKNGGVILVRATLPAAPQPTWPKELQFSARFGTASAAPARLRPVELFRFDAAGARQRLMPGAALAPAEVAPGFDILLDGPVDLELIKQGWYAGEVWIDVPSDLGVPGNAAPVIVGAVPFRPDGQLGATGTTLQWRFTEQAQAWLRSGLPSLLKRSNRRLATARLVVYGGAVLAANAPERWLDGALLFQPGGRGVVLPGGIGLGGTTMVLPFQIGGG